MTAIIFFDLDAARAAQREAWARWAVIEPDMAVNLALLGRLADAFNAHDLGAYIATVADDVVVVDHRRTGMGGSRAPARSPRASRRCGASRPGPRRRPVGIGRRTTGTVG